MINMPTDQSFTVTTNETIERLERMEEITLNPWQREAIRLLVQDTGRIVALRAPRRSGKTFLVRKLINRMENTHVVVPNTIMRQMLWDTGDIPVNNIHVMGSLTSLRRASPETILCDECYANGYILAIEGVEKILSFYTPREMEEQNIEPTEEEWTIGYTEWKEDREWDDETN